MLEFLNKYFEECTEHPDTKMLDILPWNDYWIYISNTFLNGFINYVKILDGYLLSRYLSWDEWNDGDTIHIREPAGSFNWIDYHPKSKLEAYKIATQKNRLFHTRLGMFYDDIIILSEIDSNKYCLFWFDEDVSDCCMGRFESQENKDIIINDFKNFSLDIEKNFLTEEEPKRLPLHFFTGWIKF